MEELLQKVILKVYQLNKDTKHDVFLHFYGHVNAIEILYYENGFKGNRNNTTYITDCTTKLTENNLKKALEKLEELEKEN